MHAYEQHMSIQYVYRLYGYMVSICMLYIPAILCTYTCVYILYTYVIYMHIHIYVGVCIYACTHIYMVFSKRKNKDATFFKWFEVFRKITLPAGHKQLLWTLWLIFTCVAIVGPSAGLGQGQLHAASSAGRKGQPKTTKAGAEIGAHVWGPVPESQGCTHGFGTPHRHICLQQSCRFPPHKTNGQFSRRPLTSPFL